MPDANSTLRGKSTIACAFCNRKFPLTHDYFPSTIYAQCWACFAMDRGVDQCPKCGNVEKVYTSWTLVKRWFWPGWMPGAWREGRMTWFRCVTCDIEGSR